MVLEPLALASTGARGRRPATLSRSRRSATTATATRSSTACAPPARSATPGRESCFAPWLWRVVAERAATRPQGSYVAGLLEEGAAAAARKVGEEGVEAALAGASESDERLVEELADLWFHSYVLLAARVSTRRRSRTSSPPSRGARLVDRAVDARDRLRPGWRRLPSRGREQARGDEHDRLVNRAGDEQGPTCHEASSGQRHSASATRIGPLSMARSRNPSASRPTASAALSPAAVASRRSASSTRHRSRRTDLAVRSARTSANGTSTTSGDSISCGIGLVQPLRVAGRERRAPGSPPSTRPRRARRAARARARRSRSPRAARVRPPRRASRRRRPCRQAARA